MLERGAKEFFPGFFGGERQDRRHQLQECLRDLKQGGLRAATSLAIGRRGVKTVFQDV